MRPPHPPASAVVPRASPGLATAALVCGIVGLLMFFMVVVSIVALVLGLVAASHAKRAPGPGSGLGRARAGWIMGAVGVAGFAALMVGAALTGGFETDDVSVHDLDVEVAQHRYMDEDTFAWNDALAATLGRAIRPLLEACL